MKIDFPEILSAYLTNYLPLQQGLSVNTIKSYRDSFTILLRYCRDVLGIRPESLKMQDFTRKMVSSYLLWLEQNKGSSISTVNHRLSTIQAFMKYAAVEYPEYLSICSAVLAIKPKRAPVKAIDYLSIDELKVIFAQPDQKTLEGRRDLAILALLYDSGARVQELIDLKLGDVRVQKPVTVTLCGKGNKSRIVPIMPETVRILNNYLSDNVNSETGRVLFTNRNGGKFSRSGMEFIISKYVDVAKSVMPALHGKKVTPHVFRHSKAMHLVQAGVNIIYIRDILGHISVQTTEVYAKADSDAKRKALEGASKNILPKSKYTAPQKRELLDWLKQLV